MCTYMNKEVIEIVISKQASKMFELRIVSPLALKASENDYIGAPVSGELYMWAGSHCFPHQ